jgi:hypothetical protein
LPVLGGISGSYRTISSIINSYSHSDVLWDNSIIALNHDGITAQHDFRINEVRNLK